MRKQVERFLRLFKQGWDKRFSLIRSNERMSRELSILRAAFAECCTDNDNMQKELARLRTENEELKSWQGYESWQTIKAENEKLKELLRWIPIPPLPKDAHDNPEPLETA